MSEKRVHAHARVTLTVEIAVTDTWGEDCKLDQVYRQAAQSAVGEVRNGLARALDCGRARIIGEVKAVAILADKETGT